MIDSSIFQGKKAAYYTLGCKLNYSETSTFGKLLSDLGVTAVDNKHDKADICLINTCSVTEVADRKCRQAIRRMVREHEGALIVVTGCYAQLAGEQVAKIPGVDLVLGSNEKARLIPFLVEAWQEKNADLMDAQEGLHRVHTVRTKDIREFVPSCSRGSRTRYFLKVQDGCDYFCTYCTIPFARGFSRNPSIDSLVDQARQVAYEGGKEIVLTGVNIGDFGKTTDERFIDLCKRLDRVDGIKRYRISSIEPDLLDDELIEFCAESRAFMPHFHIPLQSGSDTVLRLMHRRYDTALFRHKVDKIKSLMPDAFIGVDVMVGCRGETDELWQEYKSFLNTVDVTQLHVFPYSERPNTAALKIPYTVSKAEQERRVDELLKFSEQHTQAFYERHVGQTADVLFEKAPHGKAMHGFTRNYTRVELSAREAREEYDNQIINVRLDGFNNDKSALKCHIED